MDLLDSELLRILTLAERAASFTLQIERDGVRLTIRRGAAAVDPDAARSPARPPTAPLPTPAPQDAAPAPDGMVVVRSSVTGTFYRSPAPGAPPFCAVGDRLEPGSIVCLLEVMKLFQSVPAGAAGTVERFLVENGQAVQADQPLLLIRPE